MRSMLAALMVLVAFPAHAEVRVPPACIELAIREHFPTDVLTRAQAARAKARMARLSDADPIVRVCREAINAHRRAQR